MGALQIRAPYEYYPDPTVGRPVFNGKIFIGVMDTDPTIVANQIQAIGVFESGVEVGLSQPISTNTGGIAVDPNGDYINIATNGVPVFSIAILDKNNAQVYYNGFATAYVDAAADDTQSEAKQFPRQVSDGVTTVYNTAAGFGVSAANFFINLDGVTQRPNTDFTVNAAGNVTFSEAPPLDTVIDIKWFQPVTVALETTELHFDTVADALASTDLIDGLQITIKELVTTDKTLYVWDVVLASSVTLNSWNKRQSLANPSLAIVCRNTEDFIFNLSVEPMEIIAHRGFALSAPENTMLAMSSASDHGADSLEMDLQVSQDGTVWSFHDPGLSSDTNLTGAISNSTDAYIETGTFNALVGTRFAALGLSKFEAMLKFASERSLKIYPEMKFTGWTNTAIDTFMDLLDKYNYLNDRCMIQAVDTTLLEYVRAKNKDVLIAAAQQGDFTFAQPRIDLMETLGNGAIVWNHVDLLAEPELFFPYCFDRGVRIAAFTVRDSGLARDLKKLGCNGIITDSILRGNS